MAVVGMAREFAAVTTILVLVAVWSANLAFAPGGSGPTFGRRAHLAAASHCQQGAHSHGASAGSAGRVAASTKSLVCFGVCFGLAAVLVRTAGARGSSTARAASSGIEVAEKTESKPVSYLEGIPRTLIEKNALDKLLSTVPKEQWENPPEDSYLYILKLYAETYGPGKATKMGWADFWYMRINTPDADDIESAEELDAQDRFFKEICTGKIPMWVPGPAGIWDTGAVIQWRGPEMFAGDQVQTPVTNGLFATQFVNNLAFYRDGLKPWQRGLEIGMAHGYFIIGPFVSLGPLRNTPEAATVGLLAGCALIGIVSVGGLLFGSTIKPTLFDKEGDAPAAGYQEMINWHALGGIGGAGFAHALITVFGS